MYLSSSIVEKELKETQAMWLSTLHKFFSSKKVFFDDPDDVYGDRAIKAALNREWKELRKYAEFDKHLCTTYPITHNVIAQIWYCMVDTPYHTIRAPGLFYKFAVGKTEFAHFDSS